MPRQRSGSELPFSQRALAAGRALRRRMLALGTRGGAAARIATRANASARAAAAASPKRSALDGLSDELVLQLFSRAPFVTHGTLHAVCRRLKTLLRSREFRQQRAETGLAEHGLVVAGGYRGMFAATVDCSMLTGGRWRLIAPVSFPRNCACSAIVEDADGQPEMWVMGGSAGGSILGTVEAYNPRTNTWRSCLPLSQGRARAVAGVVGGRLVVAGGWDGVGHLKSVEAYTPTGWTQLPPLPHATTAATACVLNGRLYVMGGRNCDKLQVLEMSEEREFAWTVKADLPAERYAAASAAHEGTLRLMGGYVGGDPEPSTSVILYDPANDAWAAGPDLPDPGGYGGCSATIFDGQIHLVTRGAVLEHSEGAWAEVADRPGDTRTLDHACASLLLG